MADPLMTYFPLIPRPRPACLPLSTRIDHLHAMATKPGTGSLQRQLTQAAEVCNLAALIASDCGLNTLARDLCLRQWDVFDRARPLPAHAVRLALQPLLNIPRQLLREGDCDTACTLLQALHHAALTQSSTVVAGRTVHLHDLTTAPDEHKTLTTATWTALLADGTRALTRAGRWNEAAQHAAAHRGVGTRLLDGRQVTILAAVFQGRYDEAAALIERSSIHEPWEQTVQHLLRVHCQRSAGVDPRHLLPSMISSTLALLHQADPTTVVFQTRAAITALELSLTHHSPQRDELIRTLIKTASQDGYAARDLLTHPSLIQNLNSDQHHALIELVHTCGLNTDYAASASLYELLSNAAAHGERRLHALLATEHSQLN